MKKFYTIFALAAVAFTVSAAPPTLTYSTDVSAFEGATVGRTVQVKALNGKTINAKAVEDTRVVAPAKVAAKAAPAGSWKSVGECTWYEDLMTGYGAPSGLSWKVNMEESETTPGYYRLIPYAEGSAIAELLEQADDTYMYINATNPAKVYVDGDFVPYGVFAFSQLNQENEWQGYSEYGKFADNIISFPAQSFAAYDSEQQGWFLTCKDGDFKIALPGAVVKDYSIEVENDFCGNDNTVNVALTKLGADVSLVKAVVLPGYYEASAQNLAAVADQGAALSGITVGQYIPVTLEGRGIFTMLFATLDAANAAQDGMAVYLLGTDDQDTWKEVGTAIYSEAIISFDFNDISAEDLTLKVEESTTTPGLFRFPEVYATHSTLAARCIPAGSHNHVHYMYVNATNPEQVYVEPSPLGIAFDAYGQVAAWSLAGLAVEAGSPQLAVDNKLFGRLTTDNVITMPDGTLLVGYSKDGNGKMYQVGKGFKITLDIASGVDAVTVTDENAPVEYFNLQGIRVANPENGVYIRRQGSKTTKVMVK